MDEPQDIRDARLTSARLLPVVSRLTAARHQAEEIIRHEYGPLTPEDGEDGDEWDEPVPDGERPVVVDRNHPLWRR